VTEKLALLEEIDNTNFWGRAFVFYGDALARDNIGTESCEFTRISFFRQDKISLVVLFDRDLSEAIGITDPLEGVNRVMYSINNGVLLYVFRPITWIYSSIFPRYVIKGFKRMTDNVEVLVKGGSCLLQARFEDAGIVGLRFLMNTTVGVAGFYDPALHWCDFRKYNDNFGKAFASWGIGRGCFLMLPIMGPTSLRDAFGAIFDYALDPKSYIYGGQWFAKINYAAIYMDEYIRTYESQVDPYSYIRGIWFVTRKIQLKR
jgi:phospholipid-binding lipoprotein MlaA